MSAIVYERSDRQRRRQLFPWIITFFALIFGFGGVAWGAAATSYTDQCVRTVKANGGITLDCDPIIGSPSPSPSTSPAPSPSPSPSPSPTPSPTPTGPVSSIRNCFGDVKNSSGPIDQARLAACGYPTLASTGVPAGTALTAYTGPLTITTAGTVIDGKTINGCLNVRAVNVTIRNSRITCTGTSELAGVYADLAPSAANLRIDRVEITCVTGKRHGIWGHGMTVTGLYVHDCENGLEVNANSVVRDSYIMSREGDSTAHGDDIQSQGGSDVLIEHNTFAGLNPITSSIISNPDNNSRWTIRRNFFSAGALTLYCPENVAGGWVVTDNRFYGPFGNWQSDPHRPAYGFTDACGGVGTWTGNYRDDTGAVVNR